ncbi:hypothetical protein JXA84_08125 [candidate division WOR-3 bacterium]|nr:hypothetical protein [candidate division WOR-3 bacterium]
MILLKITYFPILGKPLVMWLGIAVLLSFFITSTLPFLRKKVFKKIPYKAHPRMAAFSMILAVIHAILGLAPYFV